MATQPLLLSKKQAAELLGISTGLLDKLVRAGRIERVPLGRRTLFRRDAIEALALTTSQKKALSRVSGTVQ